jgi:potassium-transporting ATPase ATP-binding subunit
MTSHGVTQLDPEKEMLMSSTLVREPPLTGPTPEELKLGRRHSRRAGLFEAELLKAALRQSLVMLRPDIQWKNPVMFTVEMGTALTLIYTVAKLLGYESATSLSYLLALDFWLVLTLLFANFASAIAEARGKAQADALRKTRRETPAQRLLNYRKGQTADLRDHAWDV